MPASRPMLTMRPSSAVHCMVWLTVGPDSMSTVRFSPLPPVASSTCSGQSGSLVLTARSAPNSLSRARRASLVEVPTTNFAPISLAICRPMMPTPELAPCTITVSPAFRRPAVTSALCSVLSPIGKRRRLLEAHAVGDFHGAAVVADRDLGVAAGRVAHHPVALLEVADLGAGLDHLAGEFAADRLAGRGAVAGVALAPSRDRRG